MYYKQKKAVLGTNCVFHINRLLGRLNAHVRSFVHYEYVNVTTLGFQGDSIVESSNQSIKQGPFSVATAMEMDKSASVEVVTDIVANNRVPIEFVVQDQGIFSQGIRIIR